MSQLSRNDAVELARELVEWSSRPHHVELEADDDLTAQMRTIRANTLTVCRALIAVSESRSQEGYPGIAHDLETMRTALRNLLVQYEGVYDCVDNAGKRYQSQGAADAEAAARSALRERVNAANR